MPYLLLADPDASPDATIGGRPLADATTRWPCCSSCAGPMQFLAQLPLDSLEEAKGHHDQTLLLFQCQNDPGMCDEWDPNAGGNAALLVQSSPRVTLQVPKGERFFLANRGYGAFRIWLPAHKTRMTTTTAKQLMPRRHK